MKIAAVALTTLAFLPAAAFGADLGPSRSPAQTKTQGGSKPAAAGARTLIIHATVTAVDKDKQTVTLKGPKGRSVTIQVRDPKKLEAISVGDPVIAKYYESVAFEVKKAGSATPGATAQEAVATSKPGETPAGAVGRQITVTATITAIDKKAQTVTIKARDPKNLDKVKVGDLVEITYTQALALSLDKEAKAAKQSKAHPPAKQQ